MTKLRPWLAALLLGMIASAASHGLAGASAMTGEIVVVKEPVNDDLFAAGRTVSIQSVINGDLTVAGANVAVEERVEGYLMAAGNNIEVKGPVATIYGRRAHPLKLMLRSEITPCWRAAKLACIRAPRFAATRASPPKLPRFKHR